MTSSCYPENTGVGIFFTSGCFTVFAAMGFSEGGSGDFVVFL